MQHLYVLERDLLAAVKQQNAPKLQEVSRVIVGYYFATWIYLRAKALKSQSKEIQARVLAHAKELHSLVQTKLVGYYVHFLTGFNEEQTLNHLKKHPMMLVSW